MAYEQKPNTGSLAKNLKKTTEKHPTHKGSFNIEGTEYWIDAWVNEYKSGERKGEKYFSLKVNPKVKLEDVPSEKSLKPTQEWEDDQSIPF